MTWTIARVPPARSPLTVLADMAGATSSPKNSTKPTTASNTKRPGPKNRSSPARVL
ncbi:hypothetical protein ACFFX0_14805 [Citricoccus parietis]|uniref:Uncharacterized protein n=1 Tax=Citricoccus parietis TaxID=592307 RepID=A0ABV5G0C7_9MICC